ncbi:hypothetical protein MKZ42_15525 [Pseudoalteromonas shioyasakiensis]|uniref:Uncharacterized protein n=1 Tax=Pseudoalteromonas shioyasakiensis TaxID=1190813 RepID=A0ABT6U0V9_9GAMM|nr:MULTISPECIES: hypothetical protein [Pseudoalteromonas]MDI4669751.1 hypothetical protein [Pseudoalteromonas shioyasakiensis]MDI4674663.1 hypothetical protein [Pseudoalteromonas shioyasakiensis]MDI4686666.1 hypothetical protein [Pseudoalteromonas shioyasakiensis]MDI4705261.1 hypothetical protein [Pseudoalteromonas shioyasakiensis]NUJ21713.1 hypothetical protein [Pseudoalteromonas sp. 0802]
MIQKLIVIFFFLFLPAIGILLHAFTKFLHLSQWEIINIIVSVIFSVLFIMKQYLLSKTLGALLVTSIVSKNAYLLLESSDEITTAIMQVGFVIVYQAALGLLALFFLHKKTNLYKLSGLAFCFYKAKNKT